MKHVIIVLSLITLPHFGLGDTLDYWHVTLNDSMIAEFNSLSQDLLIEIDKLIIQ